MEKLQKDMQKLIDGDYELDFDSGDIYGILEIELEGDENDDQDYSIEG